MYEVEVPDQDVDQREPRERFQKRTVRLNKDDAMDRSRWRKLIKEV